MSKKRLVEVFNFDDPLNYRSVKKSRVSEENGFTGNSSNHDCGNQSEATIEEEKGEKKTTDCGTRGSNDSRFEDGDWKQRRLNGEVIDSLIFDSKEDLSKMMPRGFKMMTNMGYKEGDNLGSAPRLARLPKQPYAHESPKALHLDETAEYRNWMSSNRMMERKNRVFEDLQKKAFEMTNDVEIYVPGQDPRDFNVLWRSYVKQLNGFIVKKPIISEPDNEEFLRHEEQYKRGLGHSRDSVDGDAADMEEFSIDDQNNQNSQPEIESLPDDYDGEDEELDLFLQMDLDQRIMKLNVFLRSELYYCFFCGNKYKSEEELFKICPGITESDHE